MVRNRILFIIVFQIAIISGYSQSKSLKSFPLSAVRLQEGPFYQAQQTDLKYILELHPDRLLAPFLKDAGIESPAESYGNWENTGLDGHMGGHYLSALSLIYAATKNDEILRRLTYMVDKLAECQARNGNGYVGGIPDGQEMWKEIAEGKIDAGNFSLNNRWVPWYNMHKLFAGLRDAYLIAGNKTALEVLIKLSDWCLELTANLSDEQIQQILHCEQGGMNEVLADVTEITGDEKYLDLAKRFSHRALLYPLLDKRDELTGLHANTQIPKVIGYKRIAELSGDTTWAMAAEYFWTTVVENRTISIGGNSVREHFHPINDYSSMIESNQGPETCNTYNMLRLTKLLFQSHPDGKYMDYYERALYNHILSSQHPVMGGFVYFTPMRPRHYRVYSQAQQGFWCCVGSGLENHGKYGELIYAHNDRDIFVNLFIASSLSWEEKEIDLVQYTKFPYEESSEIRVTLKKPKDFTIYIRYPVWVTEGELRIKVNGEEMKIMSSPSSYVSISRTWRTGDVISIDLPMHTSAEYLSDSSSWVSFVHGPIVLASVTDSSNLTGLRADDSRMGHISNGPLYPIDEAPMLVTAIQDLASMVQPIAGEPLTFKLSDIIFPEIYQHLQLQPFFHIHGARYMIYWQVTDPDNYEKIKQSVYEKEKEKLDLEVRTIDQLAPGEQQPESDHNFKGERTESGIFNNRHWRHAEGWFSYDLKDKNKECRILRITYSGLDKNRTFDIYLNDMLLTTVKIDGSEGNQFYDRDYTISDEIQNSIQNSILNVKFVAHEGSRAGGIYYIRLLK